MKRFKLSCIEVLRLQVQELEDENEVFEAGVITVEEKGTM